MGFVQISNVSVHHPVTIEATAVVTKKYVTVMRAIVDLIVQLTLMVRNHIFKYL